MPSKKSASSATEIEKIQSEQNGAKGPERNHDEDPEVAPVKPESEPHKRTHHERSWPLSAISFGWMTRIVQLARRNKLTEEKLELNEAEAANLCYKQFSENWAKEADLNTGDANAKEKPSLLRALRRSFWHQFVLAGIFKLFWGGLMCLGAFYFVRSLVALVQNRSPDTIWQGWYYSGFFFLCCLVMAITLQQMQSRSARAGIRARAALLTAVYNKAVKIQGVQSQVGDILSLVSGDCYRLYDGAANFHYLWSAPVEAITIMALLVVLTGVSALIGLGLLLLLVPLQFYFAALITRFRNKNIAITDVRVSIMHEVLLAIKLVKFYAWEQSFADKVAETRNKELKWMKRSSWVKSTNLMTVFEIPPLLALGIFALYVLLNGSLSPEIAFTTLSLFNSLRFPLVVLPRALRSVAEARAAIRRLEAFLLTPEMQEQKRGKTPSISIKKADIGYNKEVILKNINMKVPAGSLLGVVGPVGSGKSTLVNTLLGEAEVLKGSVKVGGRIAYVPQNPWVQHATVRDNILFGLPYEKEKYDRIIEACALAPDMKILPDGDQTEIGERGINVSGGQKQRCALARAVYSDSDLYILDSPLSAVDQHTTVHIFEQCIKTLLKEKTVVLVAHNLELLSRCDYVAFMNDGRMMYFGKYNYDELLKVFPEFSNHAYRDAAEAAEAPSNRAMREEALEDEQLRDTGATPIIESPRASSPKKSPKKSKKSKKAEEGEQGNELAVVAMGNRDTENVESPVEEGVKQKPPRNPALVWSKNAGHGLVIFSLLIVGFAQIVRIISDWFISFWTTGPLDQRIYISIYAGFVILFGIMLQTRGMVFHHLALKSATNLHNKMFRKILNAPMSFFTVTPLGPLLNSFSKDQDAVDATLPDAFHITTVFGAVLLTTTILVSIRVPYFLIAMAVLVLVFAFLQWYTSPAVDQVKAMIGQSNAPIFAHVSETLHGISVVRAFGATDRFVRENVAKVDRNHRTLFNMDHLNLWISFWIDFTTAFMVLAICIMIVALDSIPAADGGLAISNTIQVVVFATYFVMGINDIKQEIHGVTRINEYIKKTDSEKSVVTVDLPENWPPKGEIVFKDVELKYFPHFPPVLRGVSFKINAGEKLGVVGRTGSGKSTLIMGLFRLVELSGGSIVVDGVDVAGARLQEFRSRLSIIPQEPVMFKGTIRSNLDPFNTYTDDKIWSALAMSGLKKEVLSEPNQLETVVEENGSNFSLGQRQLYCLARAILKDSAVLVMDEATSSLDLDTDSFIQKTIRKAFAKRTVITIAHRLDTIIDSDKILVMGAGKVIEFDTVPNLLSNPKGEFYSLVNEANLDVDAIIRMANESAEKKAAKLKDKKDKKNASPKSSKKKSK